MKALKGFIRKFDFFGDYFIFEVQKNSKFQSTLVGFASIFNVITIFVLSMFFCKDIYLKENPTTNTSQEIILESIIQFKSITPLISFHTSDGMPVADPLSYMSFTVNRVDITPTIENNYLEEQDYQPVLCDFDKIRKEPNGKIFESFNNNQIKFFCLNKYDDLYFKNGFTEVDSAFIDIRFSPCDETKRKCAPDMMKALSDSYITIRFVNSYVDFRDYKDPIKYYLTSHAQKINYQLKTETYMRFINNVLNSSDGIILENNTQYKYISLESKSTEKFFGEGPFYYLRLESPRVRLSSRRNYMTIQDVLAKIGGFANATYIAIKALTYYYIRFKYLLFIRDVTKVECDKIKQSNKNNPVVMMQNIENATPKVSKFKINTTTIQKQFETNNLKRNANHIPTGIKQKNELNASE